MPTSDGHESHDHEDRDEVVASALVERAPPDRDADQHAEVGEPQPDERGVRVDEHRGREPEHEEADERHDPARELPALLRPRLGRAEEREHQQGEDQHLLPRVRRARRRTPSSMPSNGRRTVSRRIPRCGPLVGRRVPVGMRIARPSTQSVHPSISVTASDDDADDEHAWRREQAFARITKYGCHWPATVPVRGAQKRRPDGRVTRGPVATKRRGGGRAPPGSRRSRPR